MFGFFPSMNQTFHNQTCLATNVVVTGCKKLLQKVAFFNFFFRNQVHSADIPLRIKDEFALTN